MPTKMDRRLKYSPLITVGYQNPSTRQLIMNELIVAHLTERMTDFELRMFVRRNRGLYNVMEEGCDFTVEHIVEAPQTLLE